MSRPKYPTGMILTPEIIRAINQDQAHYDKDPERYEREEREQEERDQQEGEENLRQERLAHERYLERQREF